MQMSGQTLARTIFDRLFRLRGNAVRGWQPVLHTISTAINNHLVLASGVFMIPAVGRLPAKDQRIRLVVLLRNFPNTLNRSNTSPCIYYLQIASVLSIFLQCLYLKIWKLREHLVFNSGVAWSYEAAIKGEEFKGILLLIYLFPYISRNSVQIGMIMKTKMIFRYLSDLQLSKGQPVISDKLSKEKPDIFPVGKRSLQPNKWL